MKYFTATFALILLSFSGYSQCESPIVEDWQASDLGNVTVSFTPTEGSTEYLLRIFGQYGLYDGMNFPDIILTGPTESGLNSITFNLDTLLPNTFNHDLYYYNAELKTICAGGDTSAIDTFYIASTSLRNDPAFELGPYFETPMTFLADGSGFIYSTQFVVPESESPLIIDSLAVFLDIGHTYCGDLSIELIAPDGTTIPLLANPNGLGNTSNLSVVFKDGMPEIEADGIPYPSSGPIGFFSPAGSLSVLEGIIASGTWEVLVTDNYAIDNGVLFGVGLIINGSACTATLSGNVYYDINSNNLMDEAEPVASFALIHQSIDNQTIVTDENGHFFDCSLSGTGEIELYNNPPYYTANPIPITAEIGSILQNLNIALVPEGDHQDLSIDLYSTHVSRPGFENTYIVNYENIGTECVDNVAITVELDETFNLNATEPFASSSTDSTVTFNIGTLCPLESESINLNVLVNASAQIGDMLVTLATINPMDGDENSANNTVVKEDILVGSFDPNNKEVHADTIYPNFIAAHKSLKYLVRFQNTGNYPAEQVVIVDTLDSNLDPSTFELTANTHPVEVALDGSVLTFEFNQIFLPDSATDMAGSQGYIRYKVKPFPTLAIGEAIQNKAYIYFDFNLPILTNTVQTVMDVQTGLGEYQFEAGLYPNPASTFLNILLPLKAEISVIRMYDLRGRLLKTLKAEKKQNIQLNISEYPDGMYIIRFIGKTGVKPVRFIKTD